MKKIFLIIVILIIFSSCYANNFLEFGGAAGDVWHLTGSLILTLAIQRIFKIEWYKAASVTLFLGITWETLDWSNGLLHFNDKLFDIKADPMDLARNGIGIVLSFPLRYKKEKKEKEIDK